MPSGLNYAKLYQSLHAENDKTFAGMSLLPHIDAIAELVRRHKPKSLLDYGCGKGRQYRDAGAHHRWGGLMPRLFDPGVPEFSPLPTGQHDGIICTDVLEHIASGDLPPVLDYLVHADLFLFLSISTEPARKTFWDGSNVHLTVRPPIWWREAIRGALRRTEESRQGRRPEIVISFFGHSEPAVLA